MDGNVKRITSGSIYLLTLALVPTFFLPQTLDVFNTPKVWLLSSLAIGTLILKMLEEPIKFPSKSTFSRFILFVIASLILSLIVTSIVSSTNLARSLWGYPGRANGLIYFISTYLLVIVALFIQSDSTLTKRANWTIGFAFFANIVYATMQFFGRDPISWTNPYNPIIGTFGNPNFAAAFLGISAVFFLNETLNNQGLRRVLLCSLFALSLFLSYETDSIQGPLVTLLGLIILLSRLIYRRLTRQIFFAFVLISASAVSFGFVSFVGLGPFGEQLQQYTLKLRFQYWLIALRIAAANPLSGNGPDSYYEGFLRFRTTEFISTYGIDLKADAAHSAPLNFLASFGFVSFGIYLVAISALSYIAVRLIYTKENQSTYYTSIGTIWLLSLIQSLFSLEQVGLGVFQWLMGGLVIMAWKEKSQKTDEISARWEKYKGKKVTRTQVSTGLRDFRGEITLLFVVVSLFFNANLLRDEVILKKVISTPIDSVDAINITKGEIEKLSDLTLSEYKRAMYLSDFYLKTNEVEEAERILKVILNSDHESIEALNQLARIENFKGNAREEMAFRERILELDPNNYRNILDLAYANKAINNNKKAEIYAISVLEKAVGAPEFESASTIVKELQP